MAEDLTVWMKFLSSANLKAISSPIDPAPLPPLHFYSDSSGHGYGGTFGDQFFQGRFSAEWAELDINVKELYPMCILLSIFGPKLRGRRIIFHSDNMAAVICLNKWTSRNKRMMAILRKMVQVALKYDLDCAAVHIRGAENFVPDALSRFQASADFLARAGLRAKPVHVPFLLLSANWKLLKPA